MSIEKVVNAKRQVRWRVRYRKPDGRQTAQVFWRKDEAEDFDAKVKRDKRSSTFVDPHAGKVLVRDHARAWLDAREARGQVRASTAARDRSLVEQYIVPKFGAVPIGRIRRADVAAWRIGKSNATEHKILTLFKAMLSGAVHDGLLPANPLDGLRMPSQSREEMRFATDEELWRLADVIDQRYRALVLVGGYGGLRIGELAGLRRQDVDILRGALSVSEQVTEVGGHLEPGAPKTRAGRRYVPLPKSVAQELAAHFARYVADDPAARVFTSPQGHLLSRTAFRSRVWTPAVRAAGLDGLRVHDLRHTAISLWIADGVNPKKIAARAGHTSVRFVLDTYGHLYREDDREELERADVRIARARDVHDGQVVELRR